MSSYFDARHINEEICNGFTWAGAEKFVCPLLSGFVARYVWNYIVSNFPLTYILDYPRKGPSRLCSQY